MRGELPTVVARPYDYQASVRYPRPPALKRNIFSDLQNVMAFCVIGLLLTINTVLWFPEFGAMVSALEIFP
jgi:hypothetical protein